MMSRRISHGLLAIFLLLPLFSEGARRPAALLWTSHAMRFTGESEMVRQAAIAALRAMPDLKQKLFKALGTRDHFLALDVITALQMKDLVPELLVDAERDQTGYIYHTLNTLIQPKDEKRITGVYLDRLDAGKAMPAAKIAMLDALARMGAALGAERISRYLKDESPEVRSSALSLLRMELIRRGLQRDLSLIEIPIRDTTFQMRMQTLYLISEIPKPIRRANLTFIFSVLDQCLKDPAESVRSFCKTLRESET